MKQWKIELEPKCENGEQLFITHRGTARPCIWINEMSDEKNTFDKNQNFDLNQTTLEEIVNVHLKKFVDDMKNDPFCALKVCFYECSKKRIS